MNMERIIFPFVAVALLLVGCELCHYNKSGASIEQIHSDQTTCEEEAAKAAGGNKGAQKSAETRCMTDRGYHPIDYFMR